MPASELYKKAAYFAAFAVFVALLLVIFPFIEDLLRTYLSGKLGLIISPEGVVTVEGGEALGKMTQTWVTLIVYGLNIVKIILLMALVIASVRFINYLITHTIYRNVPQGEISSLLKTVLSVIVYIVAFFIIFQSHFPSVQLAGLFTGSTIIGIVVGLALQDTLGNLFSGLALSADQPFVVGDVVNITNRGTGVVESVSWRGVKIRTFQNKLLVISNSVLGKETIEVSPKDNLNARLVLFNTLYSNSPARTIQVVRDAVRQVENVSRKIRPVVRVRNLGDNGIDWEVKYWLDDYNRHNDTDALIRQRIWYVFQREGIEFAFPTRTVHLATQSENALPEERFDNFAERLIRVSIFAALSDDEIERLASSSTSRVYAPGEAIVRMGKDGNSMFVIIRGSVSVQVPEKSEQRIIKDLGENDFFGEMSLLTGEPRSANVIAVDETEVLQIKKSAFKPIIENNPALVDSISELIEERKVLLATETDRQDENQGDGQKGLMRSIRKFFGLK